MSAEFLYRIRPTRLAMLTSGPTPEEAGATQAHFNYLDAAREAGVVLAAGRTLTADENTFGIVILRAPNEELAREFMEHDPAVRAGVMHAELFPFRVALWSARPAPGEAAAHEEPQPPARVLLPPVEIE
ncbi:MAG: YciI family protein [Polyangiaceae bacterium]